MQEEVPLDEDEAEEQPEDIPDEDEDETVEEEEDEEDKPKTKKVDKTVWDWTLVNDNKPIWTRKYASVALMCSDLCKQKQ